MKTMKSTRKSRATDRLNLEMLSPSAYRISSKISFTTLYITAALALFVVWFEPKNSLLIAKIFISLAIIFCASVFTMAVASVTKTDPDAARHQSFRLTTPSNDEQKSDQAPKS